MLPSCPVKRLIIIAGLLLITVPAAAEKPKVAVLDLQAQGVPEDTAATLNGVLLSGLSQGGGIDLLGKSCEMFLESFELVLKVRDAPRVDLVRFGKSTFERSGDLQNSLVPILVQCDILNILKRLARSNLNIRYVAG